MFRIYMLMMFHVINQTHRAVSHLYLWNGVAQLPQHGRLAVGRGEDPEALKTQTPTRVRNTSVLHLQVSSGDFLTMGSNSMQVMPSVLPSRVPL